MLIEYQNVVRIVKFSVPNYSDEDTCNQCRENDTKNTMFVCSCVHLSSCHHGIHFVIIKEFDIISVCLVEKADSLSDFDIFHYFKLRK